MTNRTTMFRAAAALAAAAALSGCASAPMASVAESDVRALYPLGKVYDCAAVGMPDMRNNVQNTASPGFGCAHQSNITTMVSDVRDLERARALTPPDRAARERVIDKYRRGEDTAVPVRARGTESLIETE